MPIFFARSIFDVVITNILKDVVDHFVELASLPFFDGHVLIGVLAHCSSATSA